MHVKASAQPRPRGRWLLPVREARSAVTVGTAKGAKIGQQQQTTTAKMSAFTNKFSAYTKTQLNEILEDDEKLTKMVLEMEEVGLRCSAEPCVS